MKQTLFLISLALLLALSYAAMADTKSSHNESSVTKNQMISHLEAGRKQHIVVYGTSLTAGGAWVGQIGQILNKKYPDLVKITNSGGGGKYSDWGVKNLQKKVIDLKPDAVFIEFAINDSVERFNFPLEKSKENLESMINRIQKELPSCVIILQVMNPVTGRPKGHDGYRPHLDKYYQMYREVAAAEKLTLVDHAPSWKSVLDQGEDAFIKLAPDGLHPNAEASTRIITPNILKALGIEPTTP